MNSVYEIALKRMIDFNENVAETLNSYVERESNQNELFWLLHNNYMSSSYSLFEDDKDVLNLAEKVGFKIANNIDLLDSIKKFERDNYIISTYIQEHTFTYQRSAVSHIRRARNDFWSGHIKQKNLDEFIHTALIMEKVRIQSLRYMYIASAFKAQFDYGADEKLIKVLIKDKFNYNTTIKLSKDLYPAMYGVFLETRCFTLSENEVKNL